MTESQLMYAAMLALTKQNMAQRMGPNSTALMQGMVINNNIVAGDTVCCYYNDSGNLLRVGDCPSSDGFFVDEENRMYDYNNGYIRIRDGLSGYVYDDESVPAYGFRVIGGGACCAFKVSDSTNQWRFFHPDGTSADIALPGSIDTVGYRNGLISVGYKTDRYTAKITIYRKNGELVGTLADWPLTYVVDTDVAYTIPINENAAIGFARIYAMSANYTVTARVSSISAVTLDLFPDYMVYGGVYSYLGYDQSYFYGLARLASEVDPSEPLDDWVLIRWSIDDFDGPEEVGEYYTEPSFYSPPTQWGSLIANIDGSNRLYEISTMTQLYGLTGLPGTSLVRENEAFLWIYGSGVYQKTGLGWLMYPTAVYPRSAPYGKLGYSLRNTNIGKNGLAIVLFE